MAELESVLVLASVLVVVALSDFLVESVLLVFGELALSADGLVDFVAESAGLFVEAGTVALAEGLVVVVDAGVGVGIGFTGTLPEGVTLAAAVAAGVALAAGVDVAETLAVAIGVAAGVALGSVEALVLEVVVAPLVVPGAVVTPTLKLGVTP